jgi:hypothetical protein
VIQLAGVVFRTFAPMLLSDQEFNFLIRFMSGFGISLHTFHKMSWGVLPVVLFLKEVA